MKKISKILFSLCMVWVLGNSFSMTVEAGTETRTFELTEDNRYNPEFYKPLSSSADTLDRAGGETLPAGLEETVVNALLNHQDRIDISAYKLTLSDSQWSTCFFQILNNHPELFFVANSVGVSYYQGSDYAATYGPSYTMSKAEADSAMIQIDEIANQATELVSNDMTDYEKALVVHDWLAVYCEYDYDNYLKSVDGTGSIPDVSHSIYGALINKMAVCDGYADAYKYIMENKLGIETYVISSDEIAHAWNMMKIGSNYYHVDVTWDDPTWDSIGRAGHGNFLMSDAGITATGHRGWESDFTASDTTYQNALWKNSNGMVIPYNDYWYYVDSEEGRLLKAADLLGNQKTILYNFDSWNTTSGGYWVGCYSYTQKYKKYLIFNDAKNVYKMPFDTETITSIYTPSSTEDTGYNIFGIKLDGTRLFYSTQTTPNLSKSQSSYIESAEVEIEPRLTGTVAISGDLRYKSTLTANVTLGTGVSTTLSYEWYRNGNKISLATANTYKLTSEDIGKTITVKVEGQDYSGALSYTTTEILKAIPAEPTIDFSLNGNRGNRLSTVTLLTGYTWSTPDTLMDTIGDHSYGVIYCPDNTLYESISGLNVMVTVTCINHEYDEGTVIKEPTMNENGIKRFTCRYCDATKDENVSLPPNTENGTGNSTGTSGGTDTGNGSENDSDTNSEQDLENNDDIDNTDEEDEVTIRKGITFVDTKSKNKYKITKVTDSIIEASFIGNTAKNKKTITIPATVEFQNETIKITKIAKNALKNNKKIKKITIGKNITQIEANVFSGCKNLKTITIKSTKIKSFGKNCIKNINKKATIKCPKAKKNFYKKKLTKKTGFISSMKIK